MEKVRDFMSTELTVLSPDEHVLRAMRLLIDRGLSGAPVLDERGNLLGVLTQRDCLTVAFRTSYHGDEAGRVEEYMTRDVETVDADTSLVEVIERFYKSPRRRFPVLDGGRIVGLISRRDVLRAFLEMI
jgi:CBS domain-containing protein